MDTRPPTAPPQIFDAALLEQRRLRADASGRADFLQRLAADETAERLSEVNRTFRHVAFVGPCPSVWSPALAAAGAPLSVAAPDAPILELAVGGFDLVVHGLALHWSDDPVGQLVQARLALRPDGLLIAALFAGRTLAELRAALAEAEIAETGGLSPRVAPMGEIRDLGGLLQRAGFALPVADARQVDVEYADAFALMRDLRAMGETNVMRDRLRAPTPRRVFARAAAIYADRFAGGAGRVRATFEIVFLTGWAPGPGQQKPLRPGSAVARLADALGASGQEPPRPGDDRPPDPGTD